MNVRMPCIATLIKSECTQCPINTLKRPRPQRPLPIDECPAHAHNINPIPINTDIKTIPPANPLPPLPNPLVNSAEPGVELDVELDVELGVVTALVKLAVPTVTPPV